MGVFAMNLFQKILNWVFPRFCLGCGREGLNICADCFGSLELEHEQVCPHCRRDNDTGSFCCDKCGRNYYFDQLIVALPYDHQGLLKKLIVSFKYKFVGEMGNILANILWEKLEFYKGEKPIVVPVPLDKNKLKKRGFNQAKVLADKLGLEVWDCLGRKFNPQRQADLRRAGRLKNLEGLFYLKAGYDGSRTDLAGRNVILVDDVATTCTTLNECSKVLKTAGVKNICGLVLGRGK